MSNIILYVIILILFVGLVIHEWRLWHLHKFVRILYMKLALDEAKKAVQDNIEDNK